MILIVLFDSQIGLLFVAAKREIERWGFYEDSRSHSQRSLSAQRRWEERQYYYKQSNH